MRSQATRRILSLIIALTMMLAPFTMNVFAVDADMPTDGNDLTAVWEPQPVERSTQVNAPQELEPFSYPEGYRTGLPEGMEFTMPKLRPQTRSGLSKSTKLVNNPSAGSTQYTFIGDNGPFTATVRAVGAHCVVYVQDTSANAGDYTTKAGAIANEFDNYIYPIVTGIVGTPLLRGYPYANIINLTNSKINIVLYDINDPNAAGVGTAGYFTGEDFFINDQYYPDSNEGAIVYIDSSGAFGGPNTLAGELATYGTLAHEFQHLINFSYFFQEFVDQIGNVDARATWQNEGLSGLAEAIYRSTRYSYAMDTSHLESFLEDAFISTVGYTPTNTQWTAQNTATGVLPPYYILGSYGAAAIQMIEYYYMNGKTQELASSTNLGYNGSIADVGQHSNKGGYNTFFAEMALATATASPTGQWISATGVNLWGRRLAVGQNYDTAFAGVKKLDSATTVNGAQRSYYSQVFLSDPIGTNANTAIIEIPQNTNAKYYAILPYGSTTPVVTNQDWADAAKVPYELNSGLNSLPVGRNNRFAVVAINFADAVNESISFTTSMVKSITASSVTISPDTVIFKDTSVGATFTVDLATGDIADGEIIDVKVVKVSDNLDVTASFTIPTVTVNNDRAQAVLTANAELLPGKYRIEFEKDNATATAEFVVSVKAELDSSMSGSILVDTSGVVINFDSTVKSGSGKVIVSAGATDYVATVPAGLDADTVSIPVSDFKNGTQPLFLVYDETYTVSIESGAFLSSEDDPVPAQSNIGSFTTENEPASPTVLPVSIKVEKNDTSLFAIFFGQGTNVDEAYITSGDATIAEVNPSSVTANSYVTVTGKKAGTTNISIGFSGKDANGDDYAPVNVSVEVTDSTPPVVNPPSTDSGSSGGGGSSRADTTAPISIWSPLTTSSALSKVTGELNKASSKESGKATVVFKNVSGITLATMKALADAAAKVGVKLTVHVDTVIDGKIVLRQSFDPSTATKTVSFGGSLTSDTAKKVLGKFNTYFSNKLEVLNLNQKDDFGMPVHNALSTKSLVADTVLYQYTISTNKFVLLDKHNAWNDIKGYMHFDSSLGGNFILSNGKFKSK